MPSRLFLQAFGQPVSDGRLYVKHWLQEVVLGPNQPLLYRQSSGTGAWQHSASYPQHCEGRLNVYQELKFLVYRVLRLTRVTETDVQRVRKPNRPAGLGHVAQLCQSACQVLALRAALRQQSQYLM